MTERSKLAQGKAGAGAKLTASVANKAFSEKTAGLDRSANALINRTTPRVPQDPELDHHEI